MLPHLKRRFENLPYPYHPADSIGRWRRRGERYRTGRRWLYLETVQSGDSAHKSKTAHQEQSGVETNLYQTADAVYQRYRRYSRRKRHSHKNWRPIRHTNPENYKWQPAKPGVQCEETRRNAKYESAYPLSESEAAHQLYHYRAGKRRAPETLGRAATN